MKLNMAELVGEADMNHLNCHSYKYSLMLATSRSKQEHLEQVAQGYMQSGFEYLWRCRVQNLFAQSILVSPPSQ